MKSLSPNIFVQNMQQTISFYKGLGFTTVTTVPDTGDDLVWAMMTNGNVSFMFQTLASLGNDLPDISRSRGGSLLLYISLENIRDFFANIEDAVTVLKKLETTFYGATEFSILDPNGYVLTFAEHE